MKRIFAVLTSFTLCAGSASAETLMYDYFSSLGPVDAFNSRGQPLNDICQIAQQDRANWHRFGKREQNDGGDFFFDSPDRRALFSQVCQYDRNYYANAGDRIRSGTRSYYVYVRTYGTNGNVTRIQISEGAG